MQTEIGQSESSSITRKFRKWLDRYLYTLRFHSCKTRRASPEQEKEQRTHTRLIMTLLLRDFLVAVRENNKTGKTARVSRGCPGLSDRPGLGIALQQPLTTGTTSPHHLRRNKKIPNKINKRNEHGKKHKNLTSPLPTTASRPHC
jgi:hypothetical protein